MVLEDVIERIRNLISGRSKDSTYQSVCKELGPSLYEYKLKKVRNRIREVAPEALQSLEGLLKRMRELDYLRISENIVDEYGPFICSLTGNFYYGILTGIDSAVQLYIPNILRIRRISNLITALEYLASDYMLERFFMAYLRKVDKEFRKQTGYSISELLYIKGIKAFRDNMNNMVTLEYSSYEEAWNVAAITEKLVEDPKGNRKYLYGYI
jgi:hypothetical protein